MFHRILVGVDGSMLAREALARAVELAEAGHGRLGLLSSAPWRSCAGVGRPGGTAPEPGPPRAGSASLGGAQRRGSRAAGARANPDNEVGGPRAPRSRSPSRGAHRLLGSRGRRRVPPAPPASLLGGRAAQPPQRRSRARGARGSGRGAPRPRRPASAAARAAAGSAEDRLSRAGHSPRGHA